jgi:hypothetical protein
MREQDLAAVLFAQGLGSGLSTEQVIDELGAMTWPSFVNALAFREALADAAETQLRQQLEQQLAMIRRKIDVPQPAIGQPAAAQRATVVPEPRSEPLVAEPTPTAPNVAPVEALSAPPPPPERNATPEPVAAGRAPLDEELDDELPSDATMVWTTQHGERSDPE